MPTKLTKAVNLVLLYLRRSARASGSGSSAVEAGAELGPKAKLLRPGLACGREPARVRVKLEKASVVTAEDGLNF